FLFSEEIAFGFADFDIETPDRTHVVLLDTFSVNSRTKSVTIDNLRIRPIHEGLIERPVSLRGHVDRFMLQGINFLNLLHKEHILLDKIHLYSPEMDITRYPDIEVEKDDQDLPEWIEFVNIGELAITNGQLRLANEDQPILNLGRYNASVHDFSLDSILLAQDQIEHRLEQFLFDGQSLSVLLPELDHTLKIDEVTVDQASRTLDLVDITFEPNFQHDTLNQISLESPGGLHLTGFDLEQALLDNQWLIEEARLKRPALRLLFAENTSNEKVNPDDIYQGIADQFNLLTVDSFVFDSGSVDFKKADQAFHASYIDLLIDDFVVDKKVPRDTTKFFFAKDYSLTIMHPYWSLPFLKDSISLSRISVHKSGEHLEIDSICFVSGEDRVNQVKLQIPQIQIEKLGLPILLDHQKLHLQSIRLSNPSITYEQNLTDASGIPEKLPLGQIGINEIKVDTFQILGTSLGYRDNTPQDALELNFNDLNITIVKLSADTISKIDGEQLFWNNDIILTGSGFDYYITDSLNKVSVGNYRVSLDERRITLMDTRLTPHVSKEEYGQIIGSQADWMDVQLDTIDISGINWRGLIFEDIVDLEQVRLSGVTMEAFRDKRLPQSEEQYKWLPHTYLRQLDKSLELDGLKMERANITYTEHALESSSPGTISFTDMSASFNNLVNTPRALSENEIVSVDVTTKLMGKADLKLNATANLKDDRGSFLVVGKLGEMDLSALNQMLEHVAFVKVRSGVNNNMEFSIEANEDYALGEMKFYYKGLKINIISKKDESERGMGPAMGSFFANTFVINRNNPRLLFVRDGNIFFERNKNRSIFNYLTKSVLSGVVSSIGARSNKRDIKRKNKEAIKLLKQQRKEEKMLEERVSVYD
ncbi:MAG: hypothetical protein AAGC88_14090, partial [Bacteroidota bacterium]